ncbi:MAG: phage major capsid protein, partial [Solirubrobacteraceae bacterium]
MRTLAELRAKVAELKAEITALADKEQLNDEEVARFDPAMAEFKMAKTELDAAEERARHVEEVRRTATDTIPGADDLQHQRQVDPFAGDVRTATPAQLRDRALKVVETEGKRLAPFQQDHLDRLLRTRSENLDGATIARRLLTTETPAYRSGFMKAVTVETPAFSPEEAAALNEFRAANEGTGSAGGYGIPVLIDPTIMLSSGAVDAPILQIARTVVITTDAWKGVSSAGVSWSYDAEASAVSDDTPTLAQPSIPVYAARGFVPYSIEVGQDYPGFADEMAML